MCGAGSGAVHVGGKTDVMELRARAAPRDRPQPVDTHNEGLVEVARIIYKRVRRLVSCVDQTCANQYVGVSFPLSQGQHTTGRNTMMMHVNGHTERTFVHVPAHLVLAHAEAQLASAMVL